MKDPIYIKHPLEECNIAQTQLLSQVSEPDQLAQHIYLFNYGNATYLYHNQAQSKELTPELHKIWLSGLAEPMKSHFAKEGFEKNKTNLSFTRFVMEMAGVRMDDFVSNLLIEEHRGIYLSLKIQE